MTRLAMIFLCTASALLCILFYALGVATGVATSVDEFKETVSLLSMLGGWVSGLGALAAVATTLWLADRQRREDVESLKIWLATTRVEDFRDECFMVEVASNGKRPCIIRTINFKCPSAKKPLHIPSVLKESAPLPTPLNYGEAAQFIFAPYLEGQIARYINNDCGGRAESLYVVVSSNLESFEKRIPSDYLNTLNKLAEKQRLKSAPPA